MTAPVRSAPRRLLTAVLAAGVTLALLVGPAPGPTTAAADGRAVSPSTADDASATTADDRPEQTPADDEDAGPVDDGREEPDAELHTARGATSVEAELAPDGEVVRAWVRDHGADGDPDPLEDIDPARIPVAVRVVYELDGEEVTGDQLQGASGEAVVRIELRNPTSEQRELTPRDGDEDVDVEVSLPLVADALLEFDQTWRDVRSDAGRPAPAGEATTRLRWSAALVEPFVDATSRIEVRGRVEDASLPRLEVEATPVTTDSSDLLRVLEERASDLGTSDAVSAFIADNLGTGLTGAADGAGELADGLERAHQGSDEIGAALEQVQEELGGGLGELEEGLTRLDDGLARIADGIHRVEEGLGQVVEGLGALREGVGEARQGAATLRDEVAAPAEDTVREAWEILGERFTVGRTDPAYVDALMAVGELHALLTGEVPPTDELDQSPGGPQQEQVEALEELVDQLAETVGGGAAPEDDGGSGQPAPGGDPEDDGGSRRPGPGGEALEDYPGLSASLGALAEGLGDASAGAGELAEAVDRLAGALGEIRGGVGEMRQLLDQAAPDAGPGERGPAELEEGLGEFEDAMRRLAEGGGELAEGLRALGEGGDELLDRLEHGLDAANLDLATLEALSERATPPLDTAREQPVGGHDRYVLVLHEERSSQRPVVVLLGLGMLAGTLELLRRRLTVA